MVGYSLHPLEKFYFFKRNLTISWGGRGEDRRLLIFTECVAQFNSMCPPHFSNRFKFFASVCSMKEYSVDTTAFSLPPPWLLVCYPEAEWQYLTSRRGVATILHRREGKLPSGLLPPSALSLSEAPAGCQVGRDLSEVPVRPQGFSVTAARRVTARKMGSLLPCTK